MIITALLVVPTLVTAPASDSDWPGWRGPHGSGVAAGSPPVEWDEEHNLRWKTAIPGKGSSSPVVMGARVYLTSAVGTGKLKEAAPGDEDEAGGGEGRGQGGGRGGRGGFGGRSAPIEEQELWVYALDRADGSVVWKQKAATTMPHQGTHRDGNYAAPTLVTDGEHVIASFGSNGLFCYTAGGELVWSADLGDLEIVRAFGEGSSPVLHRDKLIVNWDHTGDSFIVALDKATGEEKWRTPRENATTWSTPLLVETEDKTQVVVGDVRTVAYDVENGDELWVAGVLPSDGRASGLISSPIQHDGLVLLAGGGRRGGALKAVLAAEADGELGADDYAWSVTADAPHVSSPIAYDGIVYMLKSNSGVLTAIDAQSGEKLYGPTRLDALANAYASPVAADGRLYFAGRDGTTEVVQAGPELLTLAVNALDEGIDASPAIAGDELFLRGTGHLYCIAEK